MLLFSGNKHNYSLNLGIVRLIKIMNSGRQKFGAILGSKNFQKKKKKAIIKVGHLVKYSSQTFFSERFDQFLAQKNNFESMIF